MFWNRSNGRSTPAEKPKAEVPKSEAPVQHSSPPDKDFDRALDTLAAVLRVFGEHAFDTERASADEVQQQCSDLIRRVILADNRGYEGERGDARGPRRDWGSIHRYLTEQRKHENEFVTSSFGNLRQALREFAQCLAAAVAEDRANDKQVESQLSRLISAARGSDTDAIRREALLVSDVVRQAISRRRERASEQLVQLGKQVKILRLELEQARAQATVDPLTRLYNRAAFDDEIDKVAKLGLLLGSEPCLIMVDVDNFKQINDTFGHSSGDTVLRAVADNLVRHFLRKEDFVTRFGGEEFAIVVRDSTLDKVAARAERTREALAQVTVETPAGTVRVTQSAGVAALVPGESSARWVERADRALYAAKNAGKNRVHVSADRPSTPAIPVTADDA